MIRLRVSNITNNIILLFNIFPIFFILPLKEKVVNQFSQFPELGVDVESISSTFNSVLFFAVFICFAFYIGWFIKNRSKVYIFKKDHLYYKVGVFEEEEQMVFYKDIKKIIINKSLLYSMFNIYNITLIKNDLSRIRLKNVNGVKNNEEHIKRLIK